MHRAIAALSLALALLHVMVLLVACSDGSSVGSGDRDGSTGDGGPIVGDDAGDRVVPGCSGAYDYTAADCSDPERAARLMSMDSDSDGLTDHEELCTHGTDPCDTDSDGDGFTDLAEVAAGTDPTDSGSGIPVDDFFVVLPHEGDHEHRELRFGTDIEIADVFFLVDTTASMDVVRREIVRGLMDVIIPGMQSAIPNVQFGVGGFDDYPYEPDDETAYGYTQSDVPFYLLREIAPFDQDVGRWSIEPRYSDVLGVLCPRDWRAKDIGEITGEPNGRPDLLEAVEGLPCHSGRDLPESYVPALYSTATGMGLEWPDGGGIPGQSCPSIPDEPGARRGYPCFRPGALPIVLMFGNGPYHNGPRGTYPYIFDAPTYEETVTELNALGARVITVFFTSVAITEMPSEYQATATDTGAVRSDGSPLAFHVMPEDGRFHLDTTVVDAVAELVGGTPQDVSTRTENVPGNPDEFDATRFIQSIVPLEGYRDGIAGTGYDSKDDTTFHGVIPGTAVEFTIDFHNDVRSPAATAEIFQAKIIVVGNGVADLDARNVYIIVPPDGGTILI